MRAPREILTAAPRRGSAGPGLLVLLGVVWAVFALAATPIGGSEREDRDHLAPRTGALVLPEVVTGPRPLTAPAGKTPGAWAAWGAVPTELPPAARLLRPATDGSVPFPTRFTGFSYRTTGPPPRNR